uniref:CotH protein n=1 Tax=uncultured bacterium contig00052 TaxID=1181536 RepID=A0A806JYT8_9BACT|nr:hypothetical protein [uncultured bacterium contig00052]
MKTLFKILAFTAVMASSLLAQNFSKETLLATGIPVIEINTENNAGINKENYTNLSSFTLTDPKDSRNNISRTKSSAAKPDQNRPADQIKGRGNASWAKPEWNLNYPKKPYRLRFTEQLQVLGLPEARNWILLAEYRDPTFLYNAIAFEIARSALEMPFTHHYQHVHLFLNNDYKGLYGLTEHKQVHKNRINIDPDEGWYVNIDSYYDEEPKFMTQQYNLPVMIKSPKPDGAANMSNTAYNFVRNDWNEFTNLMASGNFPESGYRDLIDINSLVDYLIVNEITRNEELGNDGNIRSVFSYKDRGKKITMGPVWDFDCGFGYNYQSTHTYFMSYMQFITKHPFLRRFYDDPVFKTRFRERWNEKHSKFTSISGFIDNASQKIRDAVAKDTERWYREGNRDQNSGYVSFEYNNNYSDAINNLKSWLNNRISWLNTEINNAYQGTINISSAAITLSETSYVYDGTAKRPQATVESYGKILTEGTHYNLAYSNNTDIGNATVTVTGMGDYYSGSKNASFAIVSLSPSSSSSEEITSIYTPPFGHPSTRGELSNTTNHLPLTTYYNLKGEPLGAQKPAVPGVYLEKTENSLRKYL